MKRILLLLSVVLCVAGNGRADETAKLTGNQILQKSADTYAALPSYSGGTAVVSQSTMKDGTQMLSTSTAIINFTRTGKLYVDGRLGDGGFYNIAGDNSEATLQVSFDSEQKKPDSDQTLKNIELAVAAATGIGENAPTIIPAALLKFQWHYPFFKDTNASLLGIEKIGKVDCYEIDANTTSKISATHRTYWIDTQSFLLLQMRDDTKVDWEEFKKILPQKEQQEFKPDMAILSTSSLFVFTNGKVIDNIPTNQPH